METGLQKLTSHEMLPKMQHAADVLSQSCVKSWQLCGPLVWTMDGARGTRLGSSRAACQGTPPRTEAEAEMKDTADNPAAVALILNL